MDQKAAAIQVTVDGHGYREFRNRPFGHRELAPGFRRLKAERLAPERLTTEAVTRHLKFRATGYVVTRSRPYHDTVDAMS